MRADFFVIQAAIVVFRIKFLEFDTIFEGGVALSRCPEHEASNIEIEICDIEFIDEITGEIIDNSIHEYTPIENTKNIKKEDSANGLQQLANEFEERREL